MRMHFKCTHKFSISELVIPAITIKILPKIAMIIMIMMMFEVTLEPTHSYCAKYFCTLQIKHGEEQLYKGANKDHNIQTVMKPRGGSHRTLNLYLMQFHH